MAIWYIQRWAMYIASKVGGSEVSAFLCHFFKNMYTQCLTVYIQCLTMYIQCWVMYIHVYLKMAQESCHLQSAYYTCYIHCSYTNLPCIYQIAILCAIAWEIECSWQYRPVLLRNYLYHTMRFQNSQYEPRWTMYIHVMYNISHVYSMYNHVWILFIQFWTVWNTFRHVHDMFRHVYTLT